MRRTLLVMLIAGVATLVMSCGTSQNVNQSAAPGGAKQARITITYTAGTPPGVTIDMPDDGIRIKKNSDTIKWKLKYIGPDSANAADVTLDNFTDSSGNKNPFGPSGSHDDNTFNFKPSHAEPDKEKETLPASVAGVFRFRIKVTLPDNGPVVEVDPVVIIDN